jgi:hypothetical protein
MINERLFGKPYSNVTGVLIRRNLDTQKRKGKGKKDIARSCPPARKAREA